MIVHTPRPSLRAILALAFCISSVLPAAAQSSPEGFGSGGSKTTTVACDSCCSISNFNCSSSAIKTYVNENLDSCVVCTEQLDSRARGCGMIRPEDCPACPLPTACPVCATSVTPAACPTAITCPGGGTPPVCPTPPACPKTCPITTCPAGEQLWNPDSPACKCVKEANICNKIGDITKIGITAYHPTSEPKIDFLDAFRDGDGNALHSSSDLSAVSPCMEQSREMCAKKFAETSKAGFYSYRMPETGRFRLSEADKLILDKTQKEIMLRLKYLDSCIASSLQTRYSTGDLVYQGTAPVNGVSANKWASTALLYADDCRPVEPWKQKLIQDAKCPVSISASFNELSSPVSLLWSADIKIRDVSSRSKFALNPNDAGKWFVWRGSGLTPLVVWNAEGTGKIESAHQLFGTHTWGKQWKHGYEPLASLDKDSNGWLEGEELSNIALWFDFNQDGVSDKGEVKQLHDVNVTAIGVKVTATDDKNGEVHAEKGFRRTVNGKVIEGASVDWFSGTEDGRFGSEAIDPNLAALAERMDATKVSSVSSFDPLDVVSGMWDWRVVDEASGELPENMPHGTFVLYSTNKKVAGTVYVMDQLAPNRSGIAERIASRSIQGIAAPGAKGAPRVTFSTTNSSGGAAESVAQLSEDGKYLAGITTEQQEAGKEPIKYAWVARRAPIGK